MVYYLETYTFVHLWAVIFNCIFTVFQVAYNGSCDPDIPINSDCETTCKDDVMPLCAQSVIKVLEDEELLDFKNPCQLANYNCMHRSTRK